MYINNTKVWQK